MPSYSFLADDARSHRLTSFNPSGNNRADHDIIVNTINRTFTPNYIFPSHRFSR